MFVLLAIVGFLAVGFMECNTQPVRAVMRPDGLELTTQDLVGNRTQILPLARMRDVQLVSAMPAARAMGSNYMEIPYPMQRGEMDSVELGHVEVLLDRMQPPYLLVSHRLTPDHRDAAVLLSLRSEHQTRSLFDRLRAGLDAVRQRCRSMNTPSEDCPMLR